MLKAVTSALSIPQGDWDRLANPEGGEFNPLVSHDFFRCVEESGCATAKTGWAPRHLVMEDAQGRITALYPEGKALEKGTYRVTFKTGDWFATQKASTFFPEVPVIFEADGSVEHYHIPLLLSPYGFSTYRGN